MLIVLIYFTWININLVNSHYFSLKLFFYRLWHEKEFLTEEKIEKKVGEHIKHINILITQKQSEKENKDLYKKIYRSPGSGQSGYEKPKTWKEF